MSRSAPARDGTTILLALDPRALVRVEAVQPLTQRRVGRNAQLGVRIVEIG